jgi:serine phosphatase RsbU (regulator of sigma subunit)
MATMRAALRAAPHKMGPAARVKRAEESMAMGVVDEGVFVTLFHAELDVASGDVRYVDAGHGHCMVMGPDGELTPLAERSLPVGVMPNEQFREGRRRLLAGDTLIVYSDGLVEHDGRTGDLHDFQAELDEAADAGDTLRRLLRRIPSVLPDDVTVLVLRRLPTVQERSSPGI